MDALERYYQEYLFGYSQDANLGTYDMDVQYTKDQIEMILERGYIADDDIEFLKSLLPEIENDSIRSDLTDYLDGADAV